LADFNNFGRATSKKLDANDYSFDHYTLILLLHYRVKCRLLHLLLASSVNIYRLHSCWRRTFWAHDV